MDVLSASSLDYASNPTDEILVGLDSLDDGPSEAIRDSEKEKGMAIIDGTGDFDETIGGKVVTTKILNAESSHLDMAGISNAESKSLSDTQGIEKDGGGAESMECKCCYWEFKLEDMIHCPVGHQFCLLCIKTRVEEMIYESLEDHDTLSCMAAMDDCDESFPSSDIWRVLPNDVFERYENRQAQHAVAGAKIEGLVYCPFCGIPYEVDTCVKVLDCPNIKCLKASCILCKKLNHLPLSCDDVDDTDPETAFRREVEERMTKAVIRKCKVCHAEAIKIDGCNEVICRCGNTMCYVCREIVNEGVDLSDLEHFCACDDYSAEPGKQRFQNCNRCSMFEIEVEENEALAAKEEALKELVDDEPKLLDLEIGPPLQWIEKTTTLRAGGGDCAESTVTSRRIL